LNSYFKDKQNLDYGLLAFTQKNTNQRNNRKSLFLNLLKEFPKQNETFINESIKTLDNDSYLKIIDFNAGEEMLL